MKWPLVYNLICHDETRLDHLRKEGASNDAPPLQPGVILFLFPIADMPDVAKFSVTAHQVSGTTDYLTLDLNDKIRIAGRIPPKTVWDYIKEITESANREILLISLLPTSKDP